MLAIASTELCELVLSATSQQKMYFSCRLFNLLLVFIKINSINSQPASRKIYHYCLFVVNINSINKWPAWEDVLILLLFININDTNRWPAWEDVLILFCPTCYRVGELWELVFHTFVRLQIISQVHIWTILLNAAEKGKWDSLRGKNSLISRVVLVLS